MKLIQTNLFDTANGISSQASADGVSRCALPELPTTNRSTPAVVPARPSVAPAKRKAAHSAVVAAYFRILSAPEYLPAVSAGTLGTLTIDTFGRNFIGSCASSALQLSMESRLRDRMAKFGSLEYVLAWKSKAMVLGPQICALVASARRTSGKDCSGSQTELEGYPTPKTPTGGANSNREARGAGGMDLQEVAAMALCGYPTPDAQVMNYSGNLETHLARVSKLKELKNNGNGAGLPLAVVAKMVSGYPTPRAEGAESCGARKTRGVADTLTAVAGLAWAGWPSPTALSSDTTNAPGNNRYTARVEELAGQVAGWASPTSRDHKDTPGMATTGTNPDGSIRNRTDQLPRQAALAFGAHLTSSTSPTEKRGVLNVALSRWLQGYPPVWSNCAVLAMPSIRGSRKNSSRRTAKRKD